MNFAFNKYAAELNIDIITALSAEKNVPLNLRHYALVDSAFSSTIVPAYKQRIPNAHVLELYSNTGFEQLKDISPCIISMPDEIALRAKAIKTLLTHANGKPMLSFLSSQMEAAPLKNHLQSILEIETSDGQHLVLRFADTRILPVLIEVLDSDQRQAALGPIDNWLVINRMGRLQTLHLKKNDIQHNPNSALPLQFSRLQLSDKQFAAMLNAAEPDAIIEQLWKIVPEHCLRFSGGELHQFINHQLFLAKSFTVEGVQDQIAYCVAAFNTHGKLHEIIPAKKLLETRNWQPGTLADALAELPEDCWT